MECDTLLPQTVSNGHLPVYHYSNGYKHIYLITICIDCVVFVGHSQIIELFSLGLKLDNTENLTKF